MHKKNAFKEIVVALILIIVIASFSRPNDQSTVPQQPAEKNISASLVDSPAVPLTSLSTPPDPLNVRAAAIQERCKKFSAEMDRGTWDDELKILFHQETPHPVDDTIEQIIEVAKTGEGLAEMSEFTTFLFAARLGWRTAPAERSAVLEKLVKKSPNGLYQLFYAYSLRHVDYDYEDEAESKKFDEAEKRIFEMSLDDPQFARIEIPFKRRLLELSLESPEKFYIAEKVLGIYEEQIFGSGVEVWNYYFKDKLQSHPELAPKIKRFAETQMTALLSSHGLPQDFTIGHNYSIYKWLWMDARSTEAPDMEYEKMKEELEVIFPEAREPKGRFDDDDYCTKKGLMRRWNLLRKSMGRT